MATSVTGPPSARSVMLVVPLTSPVSGSSVTSCATVKMCAVGSVSALVSGLTVKLVVAPTAELVASTEGAASPSGSRTGSGVAPAFDATKQLA